MGSSSSVLLQVTTDVVNNVLAKTIASNQSSVSYTVSAVQSTGIECGDNCTIVCPGGINISNTSLQSVKLISQFSSNVASTLSSQMTTELSNALQQAFSKEIGVLATSISKDDVSTQLSSAIRNSVESVVTVNNLNSMLGNAVVVQNGFLKAGNDFTLTGLQCKLSSENLQSIQVQQIVTSIASQLTQSLNQASIINDIQQQYDYVAKGLEALTAMIIFIVIAIIVVVGGVSLKGTSALTQPKNLAIILSVLGVAILVILLVVKLQSK